MTRKGLLRSSTEHKGCWVEKGEMVETLRNRTHASQLESSRDSTKTYVLRPGNDVTTYVMSTTERLRITDLEISDLGRSPISPISISRSPPRSLSDSPRSPRDHLSLRRPPPRQVRSPVGLPPILSRRSTTSIVSYDCARVRVASYA